MHAQDRILRACAAVLAAAFTLVNLGCYSARYAPPVAASQGIATRTDLAAVEVRGRMSPEGVDTQVHTVDEGGPEVSIPVTEAVRVRGGLGLTSTLAESYPTGSVGVRVALVPPTSDEPVQLSLGLGVGSALDPRTTLLGLYGEIGVAGRSRGIQPFMDLRASGVLLDTLGALWVEYAVGADMGSPRFAVKPSVGVNLFHGDYERTDRAFFGSTASGTSTGTRTGASLGLALRVGLGKVASRAEG